MARPSQPIFNKEEMDQLIIPMTQLGVRMITHSQEVKVITSEYSYIRTLLQADRVVNELSNQYSALSYEIEKKDHIYRIIPGWLMQEVGSVWNRINEILSKGEPRLEQSEPKVRIAAKLKIFHDTYEELMFNYRGEVVGDCRELLFESNIEDFANLNREALFKFKEGLSSYGMKNSKQAQTKMYRNRQSIFSYIDNLFAIYPSMYVVRMDLGYDFFSCKPQTLTYTRAKEDFESLMAHRHRNSMWKDDLVGFIWKLEDGAERRYHYHLLLFYDGEKVKNHLEDQQYLQKRWIKEITKGEGACFISWEKSEETPLGVSPDGLIRRDDTVRYQALRIYLNYLTKIDRLIGLDVPRKSRVFGKGQLSTR